MDSIFIWQKGKWDKNFVLYYLSCYKFVYEIVFIKQITSSDFGCWNEKQNKWESFSRKTSIYRFILYEYNMTKH